MNKICGIYKITSPTNKIYIGSSKDINARWNKYKNFHCEYQQKIYRSLLKHGVDAHKFEVIHECSEDDLFQWERLYAEYYDVLGVNGLNLAIPNYKDIKGVKSQESKDIMRIKMSGENNPFYGKKHTKETIERLKGRPCHLKGKKHKLESIEKMKLSKIGKKFSEESKQKMRESRNKYLLNNLNFTCRMVINLNTGIFYDSIKEAAECHNLKRKNLNKKLVNKKTSVFAYV
jgi:group I intron endonuclease